MLDFTKEHVNQFAKMGLRTLILAQKVVPSQEYENFNKLFMKASVSMRNRDEELMNVNATIETEMTLVGSTAIEDKLQDEVAETIQFMKEVGIKVWVLTGDKVETAINIGYSAGLLDYTMVLHKFEEPDKELIKEQFDAMEKELLD